MNSRLSVLSAALLLLSASCASEAADSGLARPVIDTLPGGVVTVHNPGPTAWADSSGWRLVEAARIVASDSGNEAIVNPSAAAIDGSGRLYVVEQSPTSIKLFEQDGSYIRTIGREGSGPGEYQSPIIATHGTRLVVQDPQLARLTVFDSSGTLERSWPSTCCHYHGIEVDEEGRIIVATSSGSRPEFSAAFLRFTMDGQFADTIWVPKAGEPKFWEITRDGGRMRRNVPFTPADLDAFTPDGMLIHSWPEDYRYTVLRDPADTVRVVSKDWEPVDRPERQRRELFDEIVELTAENYGEELVLRSFHFDDMPATAMPISNITVDPAGFVWIGVFTGDTLHGSFDIFDSTGVYLGRLPTPWIQGETYIAWQGRDELLTRGENEDGLPMLVRYRIDKSRAEDR